AHFGNFFANSTPSQSLTPAHRDQTAVVGCALLGRHQPSCRASSAATPEASTTHRAETFFVCSWERTSRICWPPAARLTLLTLAGRQTTAPRACARRNTSSSKTARSTWNPGTRERYL